MHGKNLAVLVAVLLLVFAVSPSEAQSDSTSPSVTGNNSPATTVGGPPAPVLELLGRWHGGPVYSSAVSGEHVYFG